MNLPYRSHVETKLHVKLNNMIYANQSFKSSSHCENYLLTQVSDSEVEVYTFCEGPHRLFWSSSTKICSSGVGDEFGKGLRWEELAARIWSCPRSRKAHTMNYICQSWTLCWKHCGLLHSWILDRRPHEWLEALILGTATLRGRNRVVQVIPVVSFVLHHVWAAARPILIEQ